MHGIMFAVGYGFSSWIGFGVWFISASGSDSTFPWRFPLAFQAVPALIMLAGSPWLPYSPRWLMQKDRFEEAEAVLKRLHARKTEHHDETAVKVSDLSFKSSLYCTICKLYRQVYQQAELTVHLRNSTKCGSS